MCIRCKDCQYFDGISTCANHKTLKVSKYDNCFEYDYQMKNHRDSIECTVDRINELVEYEECFFDSKKKYELENLTRHLLAYVIEHGVNSWKYED